MAGTLARLRRAPVSGHGGTFGLVLRRVSAFIRRWMLPSDALALVALLICAGVQTLLFLRDPDWFPLSSLIVPVIIGGFLLRLRSLVVLFVAVAALAVAGVIGRDPDLAAVPMGTAWVLGASGIVVLMVARSRLRLGVVGSRSTSMLVDLRDRLAAQGEMPTLPPGWSAEVVLRSAYGASFSGDFLVACAAPGGRSVEVALIDVSGKGLDAGTRSLLLSGAFGGLLGALRSEEFLPAANAYLLRQEWGEGFATAVHLAIDFDSGDYVVTSAGHPPAAQFSAGSGKWSTTEVTQGPVLGILTDAEFPGEKGRLDRGDAMLLYTDGLVEVPGVDLSVGIDRLLGQAERLVTKGFRDGARKLIDAVASGQSDDRALVVIWRD